MTTASRRRTTSTTSVAAHLRWLILTAVLALAATACGFSPDTTLHPAASPYHFVAEQHPFAGRKLAVNDDTQITSYMEANHASWLAPIARQPTAVWLNSPQDVANLRPYLVAAKKQHALPVLVAYYIVDRGCDHKQGAPTAAAYGAYIHALIAKLGSAHAAVILEPDSIAADCYTAQRAALLKKATEELAAAGQYVYIDSGHSNWRTVGMMVSRLLSSGITDAEGFSLNVSNRDTDADLIAYGTEISQLLGGRSFVIDTSRNGDGATVVKGISQWCNPTRQGLGVPPTTNTGNPLVAAYLWIKIPGESDGAGAVNERGQPTDDCNGERAYAGLFSARQARTLILNSPYTSAADQKAAEHANTSIQASTFTPSAPPARPVLPTASTPARLHPVSKAKGS